MNIQLKAQAYQLPADTDGDIVEKGSSCSVELGCCNKFNAITKVTEKFSLLGSKQRTMEGNIRRDITGKFRKWVIEFQYFDNDSFNDVYKLYKAYCDDLYCIWMKIDNRCDHAEGDCCDTTGGWVRVDLSLGDKVYTEETFIAKGFKITLEESGGDCDSCQ